MAEKIEIENFGPLKQISIELNKIHLLIGPQASGKSTLVKCVYFFKVLRDDLMSYIYELMANEKWPDSPIIDFSKIIRKRYLDTFGSSFFLHNLNLRYYYSDVDSYWIDINLTKPNRFIDPNFSPPFTADLLGIFEFARDNHEVFNSLGANNSTSPKMFYIAAEKSAFNAVKSAFNKELLRLTNNLFYENRDITYIPAGRGLISLLSDQLASVSQQKGVDRTTHEFIRQIIDNQREFQQPLTEIVKQIKLTEIDGIITNKTIINKAIELSDKILKGRYQYSNSGERLYISNGQFVKLNYTSTGQQETIWIILLLFLAIIRNRPTFLIVEEPEAHLHPRAQKDIVDYLALFTNCNNNSLMITTHSPYILTSLNNLIYASHVARKSSNEKVKRIIPEHLWVDPLQTKVGVLNNGFYTNILDKETGLIMAEELDDITIDINNVFDQLYELENDQ